MLKAKREFERQDWTKRRGLGTVDLNQFALLVRAQPGLVSQALERRFGHPIVNAIGKRVTVRSASCVMYRLKGHAWTVIAGIDDLMFEMSNRNLGQILSKELHTPVISYDGSSTSESHGYERWDTGIQTERCEIDGDSATFWTKLPNRRKPKGGNEGLDFVNRSFDRWGIFIPEFNGDYFVNHKRVAPGDTVRVVNPGIVCNFGGSLEGRSTPPFERVDFFPGK